MSNAVIPEWSKAFARWMFPWEALWILRSQMPNAVIPEWSKVFARWMFLWEASWILMVIVQTFWKIFARGPPLARRRGSLACPKGE